MTVLEASLEVSAEVGAVHYVIHGGIVPRQQAAGVEAAYSRQRAPGESGGCRCPLRDASLCRDHVFGLSRAQVDGFVGAAGG